MIMSTKGKGGGTESLSEFQKWYKKNSEKLNDKRKKRYATDTSYRQAAIDRQAEYRSRNPPKSRAGESRFKKVGGTAVEAFRIGKAAEIIGRSVQSIRKWEQLGIIPSPVVPSSHRYYTAYQVMLMKELADIIDLARHERGGLLQAAIETKSAEIKSKWHLIGE